MKQHLSSVYCVNIKEFQAKVTVTLSQFENYNEFHILKTKKKKKKKKREGVIKKHIRNSTVWKRQLGSCAGHFGL